MYYTQLAQMSSDGILDLTAAAAAAVVVAVFFLLEVSGKQIW